MAWVNVTLPSSDPVEVMAVADLLVPSLPTSSKSVLQGVLDAFSGEAMAVQVTPAGALALLYAGAGVSPYWTSEDGVVSAGVNYTVRLWYSAPANSSRVALYPSGSDAAIVDSGAQQPTYAFTSDLYEFQRESGYVSSVTLTEVEDFPDPIPPAPLINPKKRFRHGLDVDVIRATVNIGTLHGVGFDPGGSVEQVGDSFDPIRLTTEPKLLAVYGSGVQPADQVTVEGVTYEVNGHPRPYRSPLTGRQHGDVITLKLVE